MPEMSSVVETVAVEVSTVIAKATEVMTAVRAVVPKDLMAATVAPAMTSMTAGHRFRRQAKCHCHAQSGYRHD
ncbi:hypothetical protein [Phyllobacterium zundukense]|uniref:Uncharacterized protein n=1 Tax=Phyllobacterium zundukense TaxID=1867719 RepID=A0ACD4CYC1_9HYPH|nr:hypothetical protein [Phyllobacterium zundukense]UXN58627.1 hypothetical protein N8E88_11575 [Phyllobacterium zundukense]